MQPAVHGNLVLAMRRRHHAWRSRRRDEAARDDEGEIHQEAQHQRAGAACRGLRHHARGGPAASAQAAAARWI
eukprot:357436-Chlamydomonas_euryale.AAC.5